MNLRVQAIVRRYERILVNHREAQRKRRARLIRMGVCINAISHGPPVPGKTKCQRCIEVHRASNRVTP